MKNIYQQKLLLSLLLTMGLSFSLFANSIRFISVDFPTATKLSIEQNKFFFVNYSAKWCPTCRVMEETANTNLELLDYISQNFIAIKANIDDPIGKEWQYKYEVTCLPTLIVFSPDGQEITRAGGGLTGSQFLRLLKSIEMPAQSSNAPIAQNDLQKNVGNSTQSESVNNDSEPINSNSINLKINMTSEEDFKTIASRNAMTSKGVTISDYYNNKNTERSKTVATGNFSSESNSSDSNPSNIGQPNSQSNSKNNSTLASSNRMNSSRNNSSDDRGESRNDTSNSENTKLVGKSNCASFGVQVGMYSRQDNANRKIMRIKKNLTQPVFVQHQMVNGELLYQVIVGEYLDLQEAVRFQNKLQNQGIKGYLVQR